VICEKLDIDTEKIETRKEAEDRQNTTLQAKVPKRRKLTRSPGFGCCCIKYKQRRDGVKFAAEPRIFYLYQYKTERRGDEWATIVLQAIIGAIQMSAKFKLVPVV
jgi:hypothetical protein